MRIVRQRGICEEITFGAGDYAFMANVSKRRLRQIGNHSELKAPIAGSFGELSPAIPRLKSPPSRRLTLRPRP